MARIKSIHNSFDSQLSFLKDQKSLKFGSWWVPPEPAQRKKSPPFLDIPARQSSTAGFWLLSWKGKEQECDGVGLAVKKAGMLTDPGDAREP